MLTELTFCHKPSINISIDITIDLFTSEDQYCPWITTAPLCLQSQPHLGSWLLHSRGTIHLNCDLSRIIATRHLDAFTIPSTHCVSNNCIYFQSHLFAGTNSFAIDLMTMKEWFFSQHRPPAPRHQQSCYFFLLAVGDCVMTIAFHMLQKICRIKTSLQFIITCGRNISICLEYLGPVAVFQQNINLREAARTSSRNIAHSAWMHGTLWNAISTSLTEIDVINTLCFSDDVDLLYRLPTVLEMRLIHEY